MFLFRKPSMPDPSATLPGRDTPVFAGGAHHVNGRPITGPYPDGTEVADFAMGCFWGAEKVFWSIPGVWVTAVGYQGGTTPNATYKEACTGDTGHAEAVRVVFDPRSSPTSGCSSCSGRTTTRPRATARATTSAPSTAPRSSPTAPRSWPWPRRPATTTRRR